MRRTPVIRAAHYAGACYALDNHCKIGHYDNTMIELVAFLGNPGAEYARTRHNAGWLLADELPCLSGVSWRKTFQGMYTSVNFRDVSAGVERAAQPAKLPEEPPQKIHFLKPETFMNLSGDAVFAAAAFFKIPAQRILVVHDELDLALGQAAFKFSGGLNGHNGLRSMKARFGTADFWRLRIGISRPPDSGTDRAVYHWVLSNFTAAEAPLLEAILAACANALERSLVISPSGFLTQPLDVRS
jgi:PTH1 family peptidyl-tRNA hydrolase